jgi:5-methylcytosine-specific restriction enzyme subunit McrC
VEHRAGDTAATAYLFDMWQIFEDFLGATLKASLEGRGGAVELQRSGECLDEGRLLALRPDIVWSQDGGVRAVLDAKYKAVRFEQYPNPDVYQMLAYCVRYGLSDGHLIYASGEEQPRIHRIMGMGTRIHCHAVDLDRNPEEMLASIKSLAQLI